MNEENNNGFEPNSFDEDNQFIRNPILSQNMNTPIDDNSNVGNEINNETNYTDDLFNMANKNPVNDVDISTEPSTVDNQNNTSVANDFDDLVNAFNDEPADNVDNNSFDQNTNQPDDTQFEPVMNGFDNNQFNSNMDMNQPEMIGFDNNQFDPNMNMAQPDMGGFDNNQFDPNMNMGQPDMGGFDNNQFDPNMNMAQPDMGGFDNNQFDPNMNMAQPDMGGFDNSQFDPNMNMAQPDMGGFDNNQFDPNMNMAQPDMGGFDNNQFDPNMNMNQPNMNQFNNIQYDNNYEESFLRNWMDKLYDNAQSKKINWCAALFGPAYLVYRKMYLTGILSFLIMTIVNVIFMLVEVNSIIPIIVNLVIYLGFFFGFGFGFYPLYKDYVHKQLDKYKNQIPDNNQLLSLASQKGGTSVIGLIVYILLAGVLTSVLVTNGVFNKNNNTSNNTVQNQVVTPVSHEADYFFGDKYYFTYDTDDWFFDKSTNTLIYGDYVLKYSASYKATDLGVDLNSSSGRSSALEVLKNFFTANAAQLNLRFDPGNNNFILQGNGYYSYLDMIDDTSTKTSITRYYFIALPEEQVLLQFELTTSDTIIDYTTNINVLGMITNTELKEPSTNDPAYTNSITSNTVDNTIDNTIVDNTITNGISNTVQDALSDNPTQQPRTTPVQQTSTGTNSISDNTNLLSLLN